MWRALDARPILPFTDFVATIERVAPDSRVYVLMELMGAKTRVAVSAEHLRAV